MFAVVLLNAPLDKFVLSEWQWVRDLGVEISRTFIMLTGGILLAAIPPVRRACALLLRPRIPRPRLFEIAKGLLLHHVSALGWFGGYALWTWWLGGEPALARRMGEELTPAAQMEQAFTLPSIVFFILTAGLLAPIVEELVFRGLLYQAWKSAWGWLGAAVGSAVVFGFFHGAFLPQLVGGLIFVAVMRRASSLRASIYTHALFNLSLWYPLLGQFVLPSGRSTGELHVWTFHLACLAVTLVAVPWYLWSARDSRLPRADGAEPGVA